MKKVLITLGNALIMLLILVIVTTYIGHEQKRILASQTESFGSMTVAMGNVITNYLVGEQQVCRSWANHINANKMTAEEAISFVRDSISSPEVMAHILFTGEKELKGLSTASLPGTEDAYSVSYSNVSLFSGGFDEVFGENGAVNVTRSFTNPVNAIQSIAFCCPVGLKDERSGENTSAVLMRLIPVSEFEKKCSFLTNDYKNAEIALIDTSGNYITKGHSFKNSNFFEFYRSYNNPTPAFMEEMISKVTGDANVERMLTSTGGESVVAHTRVNSTNDWIILSMVSASELGHIDTNWTLLIIVGAGLLVILIFNLIILLNFNRRLKNAVAEADRANRAKTEFLSTMSHDIRTPMNAIVGLTSLTSKNPGDTVSVSENLRKISLASNHLLTLINDILDISKIESGNLKLSPVTFPIVECAENLVNISHPMVKEKNIDFNFRVSRFDHEYLYADQLRINQIYINLLSNAVKYTGPGGRVDVELTEENGETDKTVRLIYKVSDTGMGMTPEFMARMYQPFSRQTDSRVNSIQGTGLGLAITKQMIDLMNGRIDCESEVGKGTTFVVTLELPLANRQEDEMRLDPVKILLADDDPVLLETAGDTLRSLGVTVDTARSGEEALEKLKKSKDHRVVILDWKMPGLDGVETARRIRAEVGNEVPILLISAYDRSDIEDAAKKAGVDGFISKPLFRSTLYDKLSAVLGSENVRTEREEDDSDISNMRILVAEDNDVNWEIISMMLEMHGVESERAENGKVAVDRVAASSKGEFDLVFMDVQMPVMNGIDATKAIRALDDPDKAGIPIIAMTADAFSENVTACLEAGMNGHIAKPIDTKIVLKEIRRIREEKRQ